MAKKTRPRVYVYCKQYGIAQLLCNAYNLDFEFRFGYLRCVLTARVAPAVRAHLYTPFTRSSKHRADVEQ